MKKDKAPADMRLTSSSISKSESVENDVRLELDWSSLDVKILHL